MLKETESMGKRWDDPVLVPNVLLKDSREKIPGSCRYPFPTAAQEKRLLRRAGCGNEAEDGEIVAVEH
ncbi:MAG: hypothetical protein ACLUVM_05680 [Blautia faecis]